MSRCHFEQKNEIIEIKNGLQQLQKIRESDEKEKIDNETKGLIVIAKKMANGGKELWFCKKCRKAFIEDFSGEEGFERIKKYLADFRKGKFKPCPVYGKNHLNWFEIKEDGIVWAVKTSFDSEFRSSAQNAS